MTGEIFKSLLIYDYRGKQIALALDVRYTLKAKNGYILALRPGERQERLPNLIAAA
ncbi:hypothetical protein [Loigolactobacillus backii]|uniref:hypothetical protein n=1 Tax=Loigolactobacillus backii TaxID=375175 RepID=UPI000A7011F3|nr:hypothetical protein [Loigolactobacillus backii]MDA5387721.1 hypothetical protein [Loigolactobacillus backii]MDA5390211.1 hypothetical protein [Loigolactobacillus backii]